MDDGNADQPTLLQCQFEVGKGTAKLRIQQHHTGPNPSSVENEASKSAQIELLAMRRPAAVRRIPALNSREIGLVAIAD
jgi:hypothetical protein